MLWLPSGGMPYASKNKEDRSILKPYLLSNEGDDRMRQSSNAFSRSKAPETKSVTVTTTLGNLIAALNERVKPEEDDLVPQIVIHLIKTGQIKFHEYLRT
jgi:hypothetical protein